MASDAFSRVVLCVENCLRQRVEQRQEIAAPLKMRDGRICDFHRIRVGLDRQQEQLGRIRRKSRARLVHAVGGFGGAQQVTRLAFWRSFKANTRTFASPQSFVVAKCGRESENTRTRRRRIGFRSSTRKLLRKAASVSIASNKSSSASASSISSQSARSSPPDSASRDRKTKTSGSRTLCGATPAARRSRNMRNISQSTDSSRVLSWYNSLNADKASSWRPCRKPRADVPEHRALVRHRGLVRQQLNEIEKFAIDL